MDFFSWHALAAYTVITVKHDEFAAPTFHE
jgi:hypothetical protein